MTREECKYPGVATVTSSLGETTHAVSELPSVMIFSSVRKPPDIVRLLLESLLDFDTSACRIAIVLYDDNDNQESSALIRDFCSRYDTDALLFRDLLLGDTVYKAGRRTHEWNQDVVDRISTIKNAAIRYFFEHTLYDFLLLLDADVMLHPRTTSHLISLNLPVVSEVYWTVFSRGDTYLPNVWDYMTYRHESPDSILRLTRPGVYQVGGLGACTVLKRQAVGRGLNFSRIPNLDFWGEDKHFCVRAACLGVPLYVDTTFPAFHIYWDDQVAECRRWRSSGCDPGYFSQEWLDEEWRRAIQARFSTQTPKRRSWRGRLSRLKAAFR